MEFGILLSIVGIPAGITGTWFFAWYYYSAAIQAA